MRAAIDAHGAAHPDERVHPGPRMPAVPMPVDDTLLAIVQCYMTPHVDLEVSVADLAPETALAEVQDALQDKPYILRWLVLRARLEEKCGLTEAANHSWAEVRRRDPTHPEGARKFALRAIQEGRLRIAQHALEVRAGRPDFDAQEALLLMHVHGQLENYGESEKYATFALRQPELGVFEQGQAYSERGVARFHLGFSGKACHDLARFNALKVGRNSNSEAIERELTLLWGKAGMQASLFFLVIPVAIELWAWWVWASVAQPWRPFSGPINQGNHA